MLKSATFCSGLSLRVQDLMPDLIRFREAFRQCHRVLPLNVVKPPEAAPLSTEKDLSEWTNRFRRM